MSQEHLTVDPPPASSSPTLVLIICAATISILPALFATGYTSYEDFKRYGFALLMCAALLAWGVDLARKRALTLYAGRTSLLLLAFGVLAPLSVLWSTTKGFALSQSIYWCGLAALGMMVLSLRSAHQVVTRWLFGAAGLGTALAALTGLLDRAGVGVFTIVWDSPGATGAFDTMEAASAYYAVALPLLLGGALGFKDKLVRGLSAAGLVLGALHLGLSLQSFAPLSLGVALALGVGLGAYAGALKGRRLVELAGAALVTAALIGGGVALRGSSLETTAPESDALPLVDMMTKDINLDSKLSSVPRNPRFAFERPESMSTQAEGAREHLNATILELGQRQLLLGQGSGGWRLNQTLDNPAPDAFLFTKDKFDHYAAFSSPHNGLGLVWVELGLLGLVFFGGFLVAALLLGARGILALDAESDFERQDARFILIALWMAAISGVLAMWWSMFLELPEAAALWIMALALALRLSALSPEVRQKTQGWRQPWHLDQNKRASAALVAALMMVASVAALIPTGLELVAGYHRGVADQFMLRARHSDARAAYLRAAATSPNRGLDLYNAALASYRTAQLTTMRDELEQALALNPNDARILNLLGMVALRQRRFKDAANHAKAALLRYPTFVEAYRVLATAQNLSADFQDSADTLNKVIGLKPPKSTLGPLYYELAQLYEGPLGKPALAIESYEKAVKNLDTGFIHERSTRQLAELKRRTAHDRLVREGKPIPPELMPKNDEHNHAPGDGHNHADEIFGDPEQFKKMLELRNKLKANEAKPQQPPRAPTPPKAP